jgi:hypothetical protein
MAIQNMERDAPWTAWSKMPQLHKESALRGRIALPERTVAENGPCLLRSSRFFISAFQLLLLSLPLHACSRNKAANTNMKSEKN